jgi:hypothetical protein
LASRVIRHLRRAGVGDARYDARTFSVRFTPPRESIPIVVELNGLRVEELDRFVSASGVPGAWSEACPLLRPVLRGVTTVAVDISPSVRRPALPYLAEFVVIDQPDTMTYVSADLLDGWGVTAGEVFEAARANLSGAVLHGAAGVVRFTDDGDSYWTSHLLLDGWLGRLKEQVGGPPVAFAPERGTLLVTADGSAHLPALFAEAEAIFLRSSRMITPMAYASDPRGRTIPYAALPGHPLHRCVQRAEALLAATEYARQNTGAELHVVGDATTGWRTRAIWPRNEPTLLPKADEIQAGDRLIPWDAVATTEIVPHLDPPRWQADAWPD